MNSKRITIFTGNFGSGKTELSLNYAAYLKEKNDKVAIIDLDVVNPYFRSREKDLQMGENEIEVIFPKKLQYADLPIITPKLNKVLQNDNYCGVIDLGGEEDGATVLGSIADRVKKTDYELNLVINTKRPFTDDLQGIIKMKEKIKKASHLDLSYLICNINIGSETSIEHIKEGYPIVKKASKKLNLPIKFISVMEELAGGLDKLSYEEDTFIIKRYLKTPWE
ncbi:MAG: hypothetical protein K9K32_03460 [Halanaerobiales bacterium]|nr:hypothetical protein [Halanaerobiales bacterium]